MNAESIFALAGLLLLALRPQSAANAGPGAAFAVSTPACIAAIVVLIVAAFWTSLSIPLLYDDYAHLTNVLHAGSRFWTRQFTVRSGDGFFRPLGMYDYRLDRVWADHHPFLWRLGNLLPHTANCVMLFFLGRRMGLASWTAVFAALLFGLHGSRPESAGWVAGRFDLWAAFFVFAGLLLLWRYAERPRPWLLAAALAACLCGLLSKEEAFVFPILATILFWPPELFRGTLSHISWPRLSWKVLGAFYALTAAVFAYRWRLLGGIGGYRAGNGEPTIFILSATHTAEALLLRLWATLWVPINWSVKPDASLALALTAMLAAVAWLFWRRPSLDVRALAFTFAAALPVQHLLLIGPDLEKSRVLYLPSVGFALLAAFALQSVFDRGGVDPRAAALAGLAILVFNLAALQHNFGIWRRVAGLSRDACVEVGEAVERTGKEAVVSGLPSLHDGVYFLKNAFPQCVEWNTGVLQDRVTVENAPGGSGNGSGTMLFRWENRVDRLVRER
jgi:hypothetical protein